MSRARPNLGTPYGADGPWLAAILDTLGDIADMLDARLPAAASADGGGPGAGRLVSVSEPAPGGKPAWKVKPVSEPAPAGPADEDDAGPVEVAEPVKASLPPPPPRSGRGSGLDAWQAYANLAGVTYTANDKRDDIIAACVAARVIEAE